MSRSEIDPAEVASYESQHIGNVQIERKLPKVFSQNPLVSEYDEHFVVLSQES